MKRRTVIWIVALIVVVSAALFYIQSRNDADQAYSNSMQTLKYQIELDITERYVTQQFQLTQTNQP